MWKYFSANNKINNIDILPNLIKKYNNTYHRSIKCTPSFARAPWGLIQSSCDSGLGRYSGSGMFDVGGRKLFSSGFKRAISNGVISAIAHKIADAVVNRTT